MKNRIQEIRKKKSISQERLAELAGFSVVHMNRLENGSRLLGIKAMEKIANALGCNPEDLISSFNSEQTEVPVVCKVGAGGSVDMITAFTEADILEYIPCPPGMRPQDALALKVEGNSGEPFFYDGWYLYINRTKRHFGVPSELFNKLCIVKLANSDELFAKVVLKGSEMGRYHLKSFNVDEPTMFNQAVEWSYFVEFNRQA